MKQIQNHILKGTEIFVGLEDSKRTWRLCVRSAGIVVNETSMPAKYEVLKNYFRNKFPDCKIYVIYEAGFRGFTLHDQLVSDGWNCVVTPPHTVTEEKCSRIKNDRIDCRRLAKNLENNDFKTCFVPDKELREDRQISRLYSQVQKDIVRVCNRIRRTIEFHGLDDQLPNGRWGNRQYEELRTKIDQMNLSDSLSFSIEMLFNELNHLKQLRKNILKKFAKLRKKARYKEDIKILKSVPGVGPLTAIRLLLEWGDVKRFKRKEQFSSFLGLTPSEYSTGEQERKGHITKQGNGQVRAWLVECAWVAIRYDPVLLRKYHSVISRCNSKKKAIVAVARKLGVRLRTLLLTKQKYTVGIVEG